MAKNRFLTYNELVGVPFADGQKDTTLLMAADMDHNRAQFANLTGEMAAMCSSGSHQDIWFTEKVVTLAAQIAALANRLRIQEDHAIGVIPTVSTEDDARAVLRTLKEGYSCFKCGGPISPAEAATCNEEGMAPQHMTRCPTKEANDG